MEIKTCEQYVLADLEEAHNEIDRLKKDIEALQNEIEMLRNRWSYRFPATRFVPGQSGITRSGQADQIVEEAAEVYQEARNGGIGYIEELLDCIHACETALREFHDPIVCEGWQRVIEKNKNRGYYR